MSLAKDLEKQLNNTRRLDVPGSSNEVQERAEALRASLADAEREPAHVWMLGWLLGFAYCFFSETVGPTQKHIHTDRLWR